MVSWIGISEVSISIPAIAGLIRYWNIDRKYQPFIWIIWLGFINEIVSYLITRANITNSVNSNVYGCCEMVLMLIFFKRFSLFDNAKYLFWGLMSLFGALWIVENLVVYSLYRFSSFYFMATFFTYVLMSISLINRMIVSNERSFGRSAIFMILIGFIVFNTYGLLVEIFWLYGLQASRQFVKDVYGILVFVNLAVNLLYTVAIIWIPRKPEFTLL